MTNPLGRESQATLDPDRGAGSAFPSGVQRGWFRGPTSLGRHAIAGPPVRAAENGGTSEDLMGRTTGAGLITFGFVLGVVGAIMRFAVHVRTTGFNIHTAGVILLVVGIIAVLAGSILVGFGGRNRSV